MSSCNTAMQQWLIPPQSQIRNRSIPPEFRQKVTRCTPDPHLAGICSAGIGQQTISAVVASRRFRIPAFFLGKIQEHLFRIRLSQQFYKPMVAEY